LFCRRALAREAGPKPTATLVYAGFAAAEGLAWAAALALFRVADPAGFLLQFTLTLGVSVGMLLPSGRCPGCGSRAAALATGQVFTLLTAAMPNLELVLLVWGAVLGLAGYACHKLYTGVKQTTQLQIDSERAAQVQGRALAELNDSREQLRLALEAIDAGVSDTDVVTGERFFSIRYSEILGYKDRATFIREYRFSESLHRMTLTASSRRVARTSRMAPHFAWSSASARRTAATSGCRRAANRSATRRGGRRAS